MSRYSTPIGDLISRLNYHATAGQTPARIIAGANIVPMPLLEVEGDKDLPNVRVFVPDMQEHFAGGRNVDGKIQVKLLLGTERSKGVSAAMIFLEQVMDSLQIDSTGAITALLGTARHFDAEVKDAYPSDRAINIPLILHLQPNKHEVGKRR